MKILIIIIIIIIIYNFKYRLFYIKFIFQLLQYKMCHTKIKLFDIYKILCI